MDVKKISLFLQIKKFIICEGIWAWLCLHDFIDILQKVLFTHMECEQRDKLSSGALERTLYQLYH